MASSLRTAILSLSFPLAFESILIALYFVARLPVLQRGLGHARQVLGCVPDVWDTRLEAVRVLK